MITRDEFEAMAKRGRLWKADEPTPRPPSDAELQAARTPLDHGRAHGFSEDDIAHFYWWRRRGHVGAFEEYAADLRSAQLPAPTKASSTRLKPPKNSRDLTSQASGKMFRIGGARPELSKPARSESRKGSGAGAQETTPSLRAKKPSKCSRPRGSSRALPPPPSDARAARIGCTRSSTTVTA
jgi:hypothetical protein